MLATRFSFSLRLCYYGHNKGFEGIQKRKDKKMKIKQTSRAGLTLAALIAPMAMTTTASADTTTTTQTDSNAIFSFTAPKDVVYVLHSNDELNLGSASAKGVPADATDAKITNDAAKVLDVDSAGVMHANVGVYTITYTLTYKQDGITHVNTAKQKVTILAPKETASSASSSAQASKSAVSSASNAGQGQNLGDKNKSAIGALTNQNSGNASSASSAISSIASGVSSAASSVVSTANNSSAVDPVSSAVSSAISSAVSSALSSASVKNSDAASANDQYQTVEIQPDMTLTNYLNAALKSGLTGKMNASITGGIKDNGNGTTPSGVTVAKNGVITVTHALKGRVNGIMLTTFSNGLVLRSEIKDGVMTTTAQMPTSSAISSMGSSAAMSNASSANSVVSSTMGKTSSAASSVVSSAVSLTASSAVSSKASVVSSAASSVVSSAKSGVLSLAITGSNASSALSSKANSAARESASGNLGRLDNKLRSLADKLRSLANQGHEPQDSNEPQFTKNGQSGQGSGDQQDTDQNAGSGSPIGAAGSGSTTQAATTSGRLPQTGMDDKELAMIGIGLLGTVSLAMVAKDIRKKRA